MMENPINLSYGLERDFQNKMSLQSSRTAFSLPTGRNAFGGIRVGNGVTSFLQDWISLRTHLNRSLILKSEMTQRVSMMTPRRKSPNSSRSSQKVTRAPNVEIDKSLSDFVYKRALNDRFEGGRGYMVMSPENFVAFGIPRPKVAEHTEQSVYYKFKTDRVSTVIQSARNSARSSPVTSLDSDSPTEITEPTPDYDRITRF